MTRSMTAFARGEREVAAGRAVVEVRSVNHRYLEPTFRLPDGLRHLEVDLRAALKTHLARGKVEVTLRLDRARDDDRLEVDTERAEAVLAAVRRAGTRSRPGELAPVDPLELLRWPGVLREPEVDPARVRAEISELAEQVIARLVEGRVAEGQRLARGIAERLDAIEGHVGRLREEAGGLVAQLAARLRARVSELAQELDPGRLEQEVALVAQRADVAEELDRLDAHVAAAREALAAGGPIGRRLDFLAQELGREANTLAAKAASVGTGGTAVELKVLIEQIREQIQNIE